MNPNMKCTCLFGNPEIGMDNDCPVHGIERNDLMAIIEDWQQWSVKTFEKADAHASLQKLKKEIEEAEELLTAEFQLPPGHLYEEYADMILCVLHSAARAGMNSGHIMAFLRFKIARNKQRTWKLNDDNTYSHVKK